MMHRPCSILCVALLGLFIAWSMGMSTAHADEMANKTALASHAGSADGGGCSGCGDSGTAYGGGCVTNCAPAAVGMQPFAETARSIGIVDHEMSPDTPIDGARPAPDPYPPRTLERA
jgi:hypothetical protein